MPTLDEARAYFIELISRFEEMGLFLHATRPPSWNELGLTRPVLKKLGFTQAGGCGRATDDDYDKRSRAQGMVPVCDVAALMTDGLWYSTEWMHAQGLKEDQLKKQRKNNKTGRHFFSFEPDTTVPKKPYSSHHPFKYMLLA